MSKTRSHAISDKEYEEYQEFLAFKAMKAARDAATSSRAALASKSNDRCRSPTIGRTSDPATPNHRTSRGRSVHSKAPTSSGEDYQTAEEFRRNNSTSPSRRRADYRVNIPSDTRKSTPSLPKSTPPPLSELDKTTLPLSTVHLTSTPTSPLPHSSPPTWGRSLTHRRIRSPSCNMQEATQHIPSSENSPWLYSRDASQEPRLDAPLAWDNAQDDVPDDAGTGDPIANIDEPVAPIDDPSPYSYPYKQTPTSHIDIHSKDGKRSRVVRAPLDCYGIVPKPKELAGGGGRGPLPLHDAAGLRMDQDFWNTLKKIAKYALSRSLPQNLAPDTKLTWIAIPAALRREIYKICYDLAPVFQHFRNSTSQDSWLIALIIQQYLQGSPNLGKVKQLNKKLKAELFPDKMLYEDDYSTNAPTEPSTRTKKVKPATSRAPAATSHRAATANPNPRTVDPSRGKTANRSRGQAADPPRGPFSQLRPHAAHDTTSTPNTSHVPCTSPIPDDSDDDHKLGPSTSSTHDLPPTPTARHIRKANKQVVQEEARCKVADSRSNKSRPSASDCAKGKQRAEPLKPAPVHNESDEDDEDAVRTFTTKVKVGARQHAAAKSPEPTKEPSTSTSGKKGRAATAPANAANKAPTKPSAKAPTNAKPLKTSLAQPSEPSSKIQTERPTSTKRKLTKYKDENGEEEDKDKGDEHPVQKKRARPKIRLAPEPEPETPLDSVIDISSSTPSQAQIDVAQTSSSDAAKPGASVEAPILVVSSDPSNEGVVDPTCEAQDLYVRSVCFSPDGSYIATGAEDGPVRVWDTKTKQIHHYFRGHTSDVYSLSFSPDGRTIFSGSGDATIRIWDIETKESRVLKIIEPDEIKAGITSMAVSHSLNLIATGSLDAIIRIWDIQSGSLIERLRGHGDCVYSIAFIPGGPGLLSSSLDNTLKHWDLQQLLENPHRNEAVSQGGIVPSNNPHFGGGLGKKEGGEKGCVCLKNFVGHEDFALSVAASPDGKWVVSGSKDRSVRFWDLETAQEYLKIRGHKNSVISVDFSPVGGLIASGGGDWQARVFVSNKE
ncbi:transcriptional repressor rco-1 [Ceratobasidium sp. AG-Ba]|nr:transcriptional repressor rco-1 [Ceratobasidium sp. AG-Ba]QRW03251.1 transcriptional repressor rco-1 [Ceratobasidium sp. AG-Ba]